MYALHATRAAKVHLMQERDWAALEARLSQAGLFDELPGLPAEIPPVSVAPPAASAEDPDAEEGDDEQPPAEAPASATTCHHAGGAVTAPSPVAWRFDP